jgi:hypothetical protein
MLREVKLREDELPGVNGRPGTFYGEAIRPMPAGAEVADEAH